MDPADDRFRNAVDRAVHPREAARVLDVVLFAEVERGAHPIDVGPAAENLALAREDDGTDRFVGRQRLEGTVQRGNQLGVEGVADVGTRQDDVGNSVLVPHLE